MSRQDFPDWTSDRHVRLLWMRWRMAWCDTTPDVGHAFGWCRLEWGP